MVRTEGMTYPKYRDCAWFNFNQDYQKISPLAKSAFCIRHSLLFRLQMKYLPHPSIFIFFSIRIFSSASSAPSAAIRSSFYRDPWHLEYFWLMLKLRGVPLLDLLDRISQSFICVVSVVNIPAVLSPRKLKAGGIIYSDLIIWTMGQ